MSCSEKLKYDRLKVFRTASVLARQITNGADIPTSVIVVDSRYGKHYDTINTNKTNEAIWSYEKGDKLRKTPPKGYPTVFK
jgi:hypothetical protein